MSGEKPFFIDGHVVEFSILHDIAYVKVVNKNVYHVYPNTPGIDFSRVKIGQKIRLEITTMLIRVLSAYIIEE